MAARKLQTEIDRTLKKVAEGVELFESIYDKMRSSTNQTQKEKLETDLKTQIKKLQRLRDQIKTWVASNEIKDKSVLLDNRRLIETQMEKFKATEKEMKTKAFSKDGLIASTKMDPKLREKVEIISWVKEQVETLHLQVESSEAEIETAQAATKKKVKAGSAGAERMEELARQNERRKWHVSRLEIIQRLLDNGTLTIDRVTALKEDITYFVESNAEEEFDEDEGMYDDLNLDEEESKFGLAPEEEGSGTEDNSDDDVPPRTPAKKKAEDTEAESPSHSKRPESPLLKKTMPIPTRKPSIAAETKPPPNPNFAQQPMSSILKAGLPPRPTQLPPIRYAAAAAAAVTPTVAQTPVSTTATSAPLSSSPVITTASATSAATSQPSLDTTVVTDSPSLTNPSMTSPMLSSAASHQQDGSLYSPQISPSVSEAVPSSTSGPGQAAYSPQISSRKASPVVQSNGASIGLQPGKIGQQSTPGLIDLRANSTSPPRNPSGAYSATPGTQESIQTPPGVARPGSTGAAIGTSSTAPTLQRTSSSAFPGSLSDLVSSFETIKQKAAHRMTNLDQVHKLLDGAYSNVPQPLDTDKPKYYVARNPFLTPEYYPQTMPTSLSRPNLFSGLDVETLFFAFYYMPGTYQQFLAAKELKRQSWRFHVKYLTWFQRHSEPQAITEEYEQGVYVYFDWEGSWCQRKKSDFRFEYRYLSED